jgi:hypothetical protein
LNEGHLHYPDFDVMVQQEHWDPHTREIVKQRVQITKPHDYQFFNEAEVETLYQLCSIMLADDRDFIMQYIIEHFDRQLRTDIGEAQRNKNVSKQSTLIRDGLQALNDHSKSTYGLKFVQLKFNSQRDMITQLSTNNLSLEANMGELSQKDFYKKILTEAVSAYYSHPTIWSEIGYAGPAYPRGYIRSERGLTDPWEAKKEDE